MQKIGELRSMTYSCADDEKHRPSKATLFFERVFMQKISIQTAYVQGQKPKSKFPATGAEFIIKSIKPLLVEQKLTAIFNSKFDLSVSDFNENDFLQPQNRDLYNWEQAFIFKIGENFLSIDFAAYYFYEIGLNSKDISPCIEIQNLSIKNISELKNTYMDISYLYKDILGNKIKNIYPLLSEDNLYLVAVVLKLENNYNLIIKQDIDNPKLEIILP